MFILATLRPLGAVFWFGVFAWMINPRWMAWSSLSLPIWSRWIGIVALFAGSTLLVWTFRTLGKNLTDTVVTRKKHTLVVHGPYQWIRHPLYNLCRAARHSNVTHCGELVFLCNRLRAVVHT